MTTIEINADDLAAIGHNSGNKKLKDVNGVAAERLQSFIDRIERLLEEKAALVSDIRDIYLEAKSSGFDPKVIRAIITMRKADPDTLAEFEMLLDTYKLALGLG